MVGIVQEKFQVVEPLLAPGDHKWVSDASARVSKAALVRDCSMPPGMDIENQAQSDQNPMPFSMGGETDVSADYNRASVRDGFKKRPMRPTDDMYTREHNDVFYDDVGGFVERGNVLDRE